MQPGKLTKLVEFYTSATLFLVLFAGSLPVLAAPVNGGRAAEISISGEGENGAKPFLRLNGEPVLSGRTFFGFSDLETPENVSANVNLPGLGRVNLAPGTKLSLGFSDNAITGRLHAGKIRVFSTSGTTVNIETPDNRLVNDPAEAGIFTLDTTSGASKAVSESGSVFLNNGEPAAKAQTGTAASGAWIPIVVYSAIVGTVVTIVLLNRSSDEDRAEDVVVSAVR